MPLLICYDITNNGLRLKIAKKLLEFGLERVNRSVFLGTAKEKDQKKLESLLREFMASKKVSPGDSLIILPVHKHQIYDMLVFGAQEWEPESLSGDLHTLIC